MKRTAVLLVLPALLFLLPGGVSAAAFNDIVAFGDSLTDNGNLYALTQDLIPTPDPDSYYEGRFSNGPVWVEYMAAQLKLNGTLDDNAYGGAKTGAGVFPAGLKTQVDALLAESSLLPKALYVVWAGANDFLSGGDDYKTAAGNIRDALESLAAEGARNFLVLNLPDLGATPRWRTHTEAGAWTALSEAFNNELAASLDSFSAVNPEVGVYFLDAFAFLDAVIAHPESYGFSNVTETCPDRGVSFENEKGYLYWDDIHPTTEAHKILGIRAADLVSDGCVAVAGDLNLALPCASYRDSSFGFNLEFAGHTGEDPEGYYWRMDLATLAPSGVSGPWCVGIGKDLNLHIPCAHVGDGKLQFDLQYVGPLAEDSAGYYWKIDLSTIKAK